MFDALDKKYLFHIFMTFFHEGESVESVSITLIFSCFGHI